MQRKTMEKVLDSIFQKWIESIKDDNIRDLARCNTIITGGCFVSMLGNEEVNDFDLYFRNKETVIAIAEYYVKKKGGSGLYKISDEASKHTPDFCVREIDERISVFVRSSGVIERSPGKKPDYEPVYFTSNAITLAGKIQLILRFYGEPEDIHENYDFIHCTNYWTSWDKKVILNVDALDAIINKSLFYQGSKYPICSVIRTRKFIERGWKINAGQYLKMCFQIKKLDLTDVRVLEDQLMGVDAAYFGVLIEELKKAEGESIEIDNTYIVSLIDKVFDRQIKEEETDEEEEV